MEIFSMHPDALVRPKTAADALQVNEDTLTKWRCIGREHIPYIKIGRCVRYRVADLLKHIEGKRVVSGEGRE